MGNLTTSLGDKSLEMGVAGGGSLGGGGNQTITWQPIVQQAFDALAALILGVLFLLHNQINQLVSDIEAAFAWVRSGAPSNHLRRLLGLSVGAAAGSGVIGGVLNQANTGKNKDRPKIGQNGPQFPSKTTGKSGNKKERIDVENPAPGKRDGQIHYHEPNNTKWQYDFENGGLLTPKERDPRKPPAPPRIQRVLEMEWARRAINKGRNLLGE